MTSFGSSQSNSRVNSSMLSQFLSHVFPELVENDAFECWVTKAIQNQHPGLNVISEAIQVVEKHDQSNALACKIRREHPKDRTHDPQYDARVRDCLTEACALAWADIRGLGTPEFCDVEGAPDLLTSIGCWVEVKAIHASEDDVARTKQMRQGTIDSGQVRQPHSGFYSKFESAFQDSKRKFQRQNSHANIVFFNLAVLDTPQIPIKGDVLAYLSQWAGSKEETSPDTQIIICYSYDWQNPCRDPFAI